MGYTSIAAAVLSAGAAAYSATRPVQKPIQTQAQKAPDADIYKRKAAGVIAPGGQSTGTGTLLSPSNSTGSNTLLGQ